MNWTDSEAQVLVMFSRGIGVYTKMNCTDSEAQVLVMFSRGIY